MQKNQPVTAFIFKVHQKYEEQVLLKCERKVIN